MSETKKAKLLFTDKDFANPIVSLVILHTSKKNGKFVNPDTSEKEPFSLYKWNKYDAGAFTTSEGDFLCSDNLTINRSQHDYWAVAFQRRKNNYVEYLTKKEGFWKKLEEGVVKDICNSAIDVANLFDDEVATPLVTEATDKLIHHLFTDGDGDVLFDNWVHWKTPEIKFEFDEKSTFVHSKGHNTSCKNERFGNQEEKKSVDKNIESVAALK